MTDYETKMSLILKSEIKRAGLTYATLTDKLNEMGDNVKEPSVRNKIGPVSYTHLTLPTIYSV